jgi:hypothetical protein
VAMTTVNAIAIRALSLQLVMRFPGECGNCMRILELLTASRLSEQLQLITKVAQVNSIEA